MSFSQFTKQLNRNKNRNIRWIKVKADRVCHNCSKSIKAGDNAMTVNPRMGSRWWWCEECARLKYDIMITKVEMSSVNFGDEGGYMALADHLAELEAEFYG